MKFAAKKITKLMACATAATLVGCGGGAETSTNPDVIDPSVPVSDWQLVWADEFDGDAIDTQKWNHEVNCDGGGNQEKQCYTDSEENSFVSDGTLKIVAKPSLEAALPYTSARMTTQNKGDFKYGRIEARMKLPKGQGAWPAFWMMPSDEVYGEWPKSGEIDIVEAVNLGEATEDGSAENRVYGTLHYGRAWNDKSEPGRPYSVDSNPGDEFHTYAIEWEEGEIRWYVDNYLYSTQRKAKPLLNADGVPVGLEHKGWYSENYDPITGELTTYWGNAPFDQDFHLILNFAVGGNWAENKNSLGIDAAAFEGGNTMEVDYVRVYECASNPETGKGCSTLRTNYDKVYEEGVTPEDYALLIDEKAPIPKLPPIETLSIFANGEINPDWPAWDCCGGTTPTIVDGAVEFEIGETATVVGFDSRGVSEPFDASPLAAIDGFVTFDMKVLQAPTNPASTWMFKIESASAGRTPVELPLTDSVEGVEPVVGQTQTYTFLISDLVAKGLDASAIDVVMIFPAWDTGKGAKFQISNMAIEAETASPSVSIFADEETEWELWDCCGGTTPMVVEDDQAHGNVAEFNIVPGEWGGTVVGFFARDTQAAFDASTITENGVIEFEMKVVSQPDSAAEPGIWLLKVEAGNDQSFVEVPLNTSMEGADPVVGEWQTFTFKLADLISAGQNFNPSEIDIIMVHPSWGAGNGAFVRVDNVKIYDPTAINGTVLFIDQALEGWKIWDCCGGTTPEVVADEDASRADVAEYTIVPGEWGGTVVGLYGREDANVGTAGNPIDATGILANGVLEFDLKVVSQPDSAAAPGIWLLKLESGNDQRYVEVPLNTSLEGVDPVVGEWQTYTFKLEDLASTNTLDLSQIDIFMVHPSWGAGNGAVIRLDNVKIYEPVQ
ncbi:family 16 glycosylhydrolase [Thalassotalea aquiviva]|uniref:family 16 glycosylhydrolase n=1 Tax=Thalassotalea aquiviva TaxID=3242415 RepID=UPI00352AF930